MIALDVVVDPADDLAVTCDIRDTKEVARCLSQVDTVFHTVAIVDLRPTADEDLSIKTNVDGTRNVVNALRYNGRPGGAGGLRGAHVRVCL